MPDATAIKPSRAALALWALLGVCTVLFVIWIVINVRQLNTLQLQMQALEIEVKAIQQRRTVEAEANAKRLDTLEQVLFGDVDAKIKPPHPVVNIPKWMEERNRELQERITVLERWRLKIGGGEEMAVREQ